MSGRIWLDSRTGTYGGCYFGNGETLDIGEHKFEAQAQLAYLQCVAGYAGMKPFELMRWVMKGMDFFPVTEGISTPDPLEGFSDEQMQEALERRRRMKREG